MVNFGTLRFAWYINELTDVVVYYFAGNNNLRAI